MVYAKIIAGASKKYTGYIHNIHMTYLCFLWTMNPTRFTRFSEEFNKLAWWWWCQLVGVEPCPALGPAHVLKKELYWISGKAGASLSASESRLGSARPGLLPRWGVGIELGTRCTAVRVSSGPSGTEPCPSDQETGPAAGHTFYNMMTSDGPDDDDNDDDDTSTSDFKYCY